MDVDRNIDGEVTDFIDGGERGVLLRPAERHQHETGAVNSCSAEALRTVLRQKRRRLLVRGGLCSVQRYLAEGECTVAERGNDAGDVSTKEELGSRLRSPASILNSLAEVGRIIETLKLCTELDRYLIFSPLPGSTSNRTGLSCLVLYHGLRRALDVGASGMGQMILV